MKTNSFFKRASLSIITAWLGILALAPLLLVLFTSFLGHDTSQLIILNLTGQNYSQLLQPLYFRILAQSLTLAFLCTLICFMIGYPAAYIIGRSKSRFKPIFILFIIIPFWTSSLIRTYAMLAILKTKGLLNTILLYLGIIHHPLQLLYSNTAVLIGCVYNLLPFMILPLYANIEKLDDRYFEAARDLGANRLQLLTRITLPLSMPGIVAGSLLVFLPAMTLFYIPVLLGGAKSMLVGNLIQNQFLTMRNWPGGSATSITLTLLMLLLILIYRHFSKGKQREGLVS
jgi:spermidine/putrescine transport system permease protein